MNERFRNFERMNLNVRDRRAEEAEAQELKVFSTAVTNL
jgi:hypothetical protein